MTLNYPKTNYVLNRFKKPSQMAWPVQIGSSRRRSVVSGSIDSAVDAINGLMHSSAYFSGSYSIMWVGLWDERLGLDLDLVVD